MRASLEPAFLEGFDAGRRFALWVSPPAGRPARGAILCVQPFGDEANLARRVLVAQACRLGLAGWCALILDPFGTGDSDGETAQATLGQWRADLLRAAHLARERAPGPFVVWGTRMGALLASELAIALDQLADAFVFWQPAASGAALLDPLLKLSKVGAIARRPDAQAGRAAAGRAAAGRADGGLATAGNGQARPGDGAPPTVATVDLAGYRLRADLVEDLRGTTMQPPEAGDGGTPASVLMLGIQRVLPAAGAAPKALSELAGQWLAAGHLASLRVVQGDPFWASLEPSMPLAAFAETEAFLEGVSGNA